VPLQADLGLAGERLRVDSDQGVRGAAKEQAGHRQRHPQHHLREHCEVQLLINEPQQGGVSAKAGLLQEHQEDNLQLYIL